MKKIVYIIFLVSVFSCSTKEKQLSETEIHSLLNDYFLKDISDGKQSLILNKFQLNQNFSDLDFDSNFEMEDEDDIIPEIVIEKILPPQEKFTSNQWSQKKMSGFKIIDESIFKNQNDTISTAQTLINKYGNSTIHNISYPYFNTKHQIAIIIDEPETVGKMECIRETNCYIYIRENEGWKSLKEYGTDNIYLTLYNYEHNTSL